MISHPHCAKLQFVASTHCLENIPCPHRSSEAIYDIISFAQNFLFSTEATYYDYRAKDFILYNLGSIAIFCNHRWFEEEAFLQSTNTGTLPACHDICAIA